MPLEEKQYYKYYNMINMFYKIQDQLNGI